MYATPRRRRSPAISAIAIGSFAGPAMLIACSVEQAPSEQSAMASAALGTCPVSVTTNTYTSYDGHITYKNTGTLAETNPSVQFTIPSNATLDTTGCAWGNQTAPGCSAVSCSHSGATVTYAFTGSLAAGASIALYYSTNLTSEAAASAISVSSSSCGTCTPTTCAAQGKNCGSISDGCGGTLTCGSCTSPQTCGGGGTANVCGTSSSPDAAACAGKGWNCGGTSYKDSSGTIQTVYCGACPSNQYCQPANINNPGVGTCGGSNPVSALQHQKFDMLVAMGENDTYVPAYAYAQNIGDGRGYTNGKVGFCSGTGDAITVARCYNDAKSSNILSKYWNGLVSINNAFFNTGANQGSTSAIDSLAGSGHQWANTNPTACTGGDWAAAAADPIFNACQDSMADAFYLSMALYRANGLKVSAPLTVGFLYDTELNFGDSGTASVLTQAAKDYQATYGSAFPAAPSATDEQKWLGCVMYERAYTMAGDATWRSANDQNATWEAARRQGNMDMSKPFVSQYHASYGSGACWSGLPSSVDSGYTVYTVQTDPNNSSKAIGSTNSSQSKVACPSNPFTTCHR